MRIRLAGALAVFALFVATGSIQAADAKDAEKGVRNYLKELNAFGYQIILIKDEAVATAFPNRCVFAVRFQQYPVGIAPPKGLSSSNVFIVNEGKIEAVIIDSKGLQNYFLNTLAAVEKEEQAKNAVRAWLRLSQELVQDGFYQFGKPQDLGCTVAKDGTRTASGTVVVRAGGRGEINVFLTFGPNGVLAKIAEAVTVKPGIRPICQATKLLDPDPIVRKMAERDILVMGQAAKEYLDEQRAKASPELQKAIDQIWKRILDEGW